MIGSAYSTAWIPLPFPLRLESVKIAISKDVHTLRLPQNIAQTYLRQMHASRHDIERNVIVAVPEIVVAGVRRTKLPETDTNYRWMQW